MNNSDFIDVKKSIRFGLLVLFFGFGGFMIWAALAPLDEGVPAHGFIAIKNKRFTIQHLNGGIIKKIHVQDGAIVKENDPLVELDLTQTQGQLEILNSQYEQFIREEKSLLQIIPQREQQVTSLERDVKALAPLAADDDFPRNRLSEMERQLGTLKTTLEEERSRLKRAQSQIRETKEKQKITSTDLDRLTVKAPTSGKVMNLTSTTVGGVASPGSKLMEIVPNQPVIVVEAKVTPNLAHYVKENQPAQLRFSALSAKASPTIYGNVNYVSPDTNTDEKGISTYVIKIDVPLEELRKHPAINVDDIQPGMPVDAIVITGERSFLTYLFKPFSDRFAKSLIEK